jgi:hypothetical protein
MQSNGSRCENKMMAKYSGMRYCVNVKFERNIHHGTKTNIKYSISTVAPRGEILKNEINMSRKALLKLFNAEMRSARRKRVPNNSMIDRNQATR